MKGLLEQEETECFFYTKERMSECVEGEFNKMTKSRNSQTANLRLIYHLPIKPFKTKTSVSQHP